MTVGEFRETAVVTRLRSTAFTFARSTLRSNAYAAARVAPPYHPPHPVTSQTFTW